MSNRIQNDFFIYSLIDYSDPKEPVRCRGLTYGTSFADAMNKIEKDYGTNNIDNVRLHAAGEPNTLSLPKGVCLDILKQEYRFEEYIDPVQETFSEEDF